MFVWYNENPRGNYFAGDCVIRAISIVTGDSWDDIYDELCEFVEDELNEMTKKLRKSGGQMSANDLEYLNKLTETANNIDTKINRAESKDGYSDSWYDNDSMANRGGNRGGNRSREPWEPNRRSNANRSMDDRSMEYSRGEDMREEFMERVEMLRNKAPDERTRMKFDKFLNDLR